MCQPNDMILFIEVDELGRLYLDASSKLVVCCSYIIFGTISW